MALLLLGAAACAGSQANRAESTAATEISELQAKQLVIDRYRDLFANKYFLNLADNSYATFPPVTERDFNHVELQGSAWNLRVDPPAGVLIVARVARDGTWVEILDVGYASE